MTSKSAIEVPGIDLSFRPASYFWPMGLETHLLSRIKGAERRTIVEGLVKAGRVDEVFDFIAKSALDDDERRALGGIHPRFMGGEYLALGELERFFNGAWSIFDILEMNFGDDGYDPDDIRRFSSVTSQFYPQIGALYRQRIEAWTAERRREHGLDEEGSSDAPLDEETNPA